MEQPGPVGGHRAHQESARVREARRPWSTEDREG